MENRDIDALVEAVFFPKTAAEHRTALVELGFRDIKALRQVLGGAVRYIRSMASSPYGYSSQAGTPWEQLHKVYSPIHNLLIFWRTRPVLEALTALLSDPDRNIRALAAMQLGVSSLLWLNNSSAPAPIRKLLEQQGADQIVRKRIQELQRDEDPLVRAGADFAAGYVALNDLSTRKLPPEPAIQQRMEQYAAQIINGISRG